MEVRRGKGGRKWERTGEEGARGGGAAAAGAMEGDRRGAAGAKRVRRSFRRVEGQRGVSREADRTAA